MSTKTCPRCHNAFECLSEDIKSCSCYAVSLSQESKAYLAKTNYDCLCTPCLIAVNELLEQVSADDEQNKLVEHKDFYMENGFMVFTAYYHIKRGYCCKSNCRHCAYGYKKAEL